MYKHILFAHDGSDLSSKAGRECIAFATCIGASVTALQIVRPPFFFDDKSPCDVSRQLDAQCGAPGNDSLAELQRDAMQNGVEWRTTVVLGVKPYRDIIEQARNGNCDLIVMASHGRNELSALLHGSHTMNVLSHCEIPVLVIRPPDVDQT